MRWSFSWSLAYFSLRASNLGFRSFMRFIELRDFMSSGKSSTRISTVNMTTAQP